MSMLETINKQDAYLDYMKNYKTKFKKDKTVKILRCSSHDKMLCFNCQARINQTGVITDVLNNQKDNLFWDCFEWYEVTFLDGKNSYYKGKDLELIIS